MGRVVAVRVVFSSKGRERESCERGWWRREREVLESLFATIGGEGEGCALFVAAWVLVCPWFAGVAARCTLGFSPSAQGRWC